MDMVIRLSAHLDKTVPKKLQETVKEVEALRKKQKQLNNINKLMPKNLAKNMIAYKNISSKLSVLNKLKEKNGTLTKEQEQEQKKLIKAHIKLEKILLKDKEAFKRYSMELKKLKIPYGGIRNEINKTAKELENLTFKQKVYNKFSRTKKDIGNIGKKALKATGKAIAGGAVAATLAGGYFAVDSAKNYMQFEGQMKRVQAISGSTKEDFKMLEKEALNLGATTSFTATEAAKGMEYFALAGFKPLEIIKAMPGMLQLAAASGEDLANISDIVSDNMSAFGLQASETNKVADIFAYTMSKTNTNVNGIGEAFKYVASKSKGLNISLEETSSLLGLLADKGIKGSQGGTGLGAMYTRILKEAKEFKNLGIQITDNNGNFIGTDKFLNNLEQYFKKKNIDSFKKQQILVNMFGEQGYNVVQALIEGTKEIDGKIYSGTERISAQIKATSKLSVGAASKMEKTMLEGANGARILLSSALDGVKMAIGKAIFSEKMINNIKIATEYISEFGLVLRGQYSDKPINKFWQNIIKNIISVKNLFITSLTPGFASLKHIIMDPAIINFLKNVGKLILGIGYIATKAFSLIGQTLEWLHNSIGLDNILIFVGAFTALSAVPAIITGISNGLIFIGGIISVLSSPILLIGAGITTILYLFHKFGGIKENLLGLWEVLKAIGGTIWEVGKTFFYLFTPIGRIIALAKVFYNSWNSSVGIIENLKNVFLGLFAFIPQQFDLILESIKNVGVKLKEVPIVGSLLKKLNIGVEVDGSHKNGLNYVPYDGYIAKLHKGERVLTAEENTSFAGNLLKKINSTSNTNSTYKTEEVKITIGDMNLNIGNIITNDAEEVKRIIASELEKAKEMLVESVLKAVKDGARTVI